MEKIKVGDSVIGYLDGDFHHGVVVGLKKHGHFTVQITGKQVSGKFRFYNSLEMAVTQATHDIVRRVYQAYDSKDVPSVYQFLKERIDPLVFSAMKFAKQQAETTQ